MKIAELAGASHFALPIPGVPPIPVDLEGVLHLPAGLTEDQADRVKKHVLEVYPNAETQEDEQAPEE